MVYGRLTITGDFEVTEGFDHSYVSNIHLGVEDVQVSDNVTFEELVKPVELRDGLIVIDTKTRSALYKRENGKWLCCALKNLNWVDASITDKDMSAWFERGAVKAL